MVIMFSMNPFIDASDAVMSTYKGSSFSICLVDCYLSYCGSKYLCGEFISYVPQYSSRSRLFPSSITASLTVVCSTGVGVVPKGDRRQRKFILYTISIQVEAVVSFSCIQR